MNPNSYKLYTRLDVQGNKIPGSSVKRKTMPKTGRWVQEDVNTCCFPFTELTFATDGDLSGVITVDILCGVGSALTLVTPASVTTTTVAELVQYLNLHFSYLGLFLEGPTGVTLKLSQEVGGSVCSDLGDLSLDITAA